MAGGTDDPEGEHDFNKAYLKLVQKVYSEQGQNILITDHELAKLQAQQQFSMNEFNSRITQAMENKKQKTRMMEEALK